MKKTILILLAVLSGIALAGQIDAKDIKVKTGYGYISDSQGNIVAKAEFPAGIQPLKDGYTYTEVKDQAALNTIQVYTPPKTDSELTEEAIQQEQQDILRQQAITNLQTKGVIDNVGKIRKKK